MEPQERAWQRTQAAMECLSMDAAEFVAAVENARRSLSRFTAGLECIHLDWLEHGEPFDDGGWDMKLEQLIKALTQIAEHETDCLAQTLDPGTTIRHIG